MTKRISALFLMVFLLGGTAFAQQPGNSSVESHKYRKVLTVAGIGGGFAAGVFVGLGMFDDSINSDRKVWGTAFLGAGAGGIGGYFIGRAIDRSKAKKSALTITVGSKELGISPIANPNGKGIGFAMQF